jgi:hypothetical protein
LRAGSSTPNACEPSFAAFCWIRWTPGLAPPAWSAGWAANERMRESRPGCLGVADLSLVPFGPVAPVASSARVAATASALDDAELAAAAGKVAG